MDRILTDEEKLVLKRYVSYCENKMKENKWESVDNSRNVFGILRETEKACHVKLAIVDLREFDEKTGERIFPDGTYDEDTYIYFWCPKKFMGYELNKIPYWFIKEKINETLNA